MDLELIFSDKNIVYIELINFLIFLLRRYLSLLPLKDSAM